MQYNVKFRIGNTYSSHYVSMNFPSESQARDILCRESSYYREHRSDIVILDIIPV